MDMIFKTIIIDDERPARLMLKSLIAAHSNVLELIGEANTGKKAIELIESQKPDLIFLDIQMPAMNGFELLVQLKHKPMVVFTTAYEQYAVRAFQENALDYLVKPIDDQRFAQCIEKVKRWNSASPNVDFARLKEMFDRLQPKKEITALPIKVKDKILLVRLNELTYLEAQQGYVELHTDDGKKHLSELSLAELEEKLPGNFIRVQKSFIINKDKIAEISKYFNNRLIITMNDKAQSRITTGTTYISQIRAGLDL